MRDVTVPQETRMTRFFSVLFAALLLSAPASAATLYRLDASSKSGNPTSFDITFEDIDGDMLLSKDELVSFGGITYTKNREKTDFGSDSASIIRHLAPTR